MTDASTPDQGLSSANQSTARIVIGALFFLCAAFLVIKNNLLYEVIQFILATPENAVANCTDWISTNVAMAVGYILTEIIVLGWGIAGLYLVFTKEPKPEPKKTELSEEDKDKVKNWATESWFLSVFCVLLVIAAALLILWRLRHINPETILTYFILFALAIPYYAIKSFLRRCPKCGNRVTFKKHVFFRVPERCEFCGIDFK